MKKEKLTKIIIVFSGILISYFKYNFNKLLNFEYEIGSLYFNIESLLYVLGGAFIIFILSIYFLNRKIYNNNLSNFKTQILTKQKIINIKSNFYKDIIIGFTAFSFGIMLGFYYKKPDAKMLEYALLKDSKWKKKLFIDLQKTRFDFFELKGDAYGGFEFNWLACFVGIILVYIFYFIIYKTYLIEKYIKPFIK